jgi:hypothetical protein
VTTVKSRGTKGTVAGFSTLISDQKGRGSKKVIARGNDFTKRRRRASQLKTKKRRKRGNGSPESKATGLLKQIRPKPPRI